MGPPLNRRIFQAVLDNFVETAWGADRRSRILTWGARLVLFLPALAFSRRVERFHRDWALEGPRVAARRLLARLYGRLRFEGSLPIPGQGTLLICNHPGLGDTLALLASLNHDEVCLVAKNNAFLSPLETLRANLIFVDGGSNVGVLLAVTGALRAGKTVVLYPAGAIEPDPAWLHPGEPDLLPWSRSVDTLVQAARRTGFSFDVQCVAVWGVYPRRPSGRARWANLAVVLGLTVGRSRLTLRTSVPVSSRVGVDKTVTLAAKETMRRLFPKRVLQHGKPLPK